jgi:predicted 2-oxoglutarate/Fe(II)-dependent dioxygenase YbiX
MFTDKINQIDLLKYSVGGKYEVHTDHFSSTVRNVSIIINLNDDYEGGDLVFTNQQKVEVKKIKLEKGSIVFFPSNFMYPHSIKPITKGVRYSIVSWLQ